MRSTLSLSGQLGIVSQKDGQREGHYRAGPIILWWLSLGMMQRLIVVGYLRSQGNHTVCRAKPNGKREHEVLMDIFILGGMCRMRDGAIPWRTDQEASHQ